MILVIPRYPKRENPAQMIRAICRHAGVPVSSETRIGPDSADIRIDLRGTGYVAAKYAAELYLLPIGVDFRLEDDNNGPEKLQAAG